MLLRDGRDCTNGMAYIRRTSRKPRTEALTVMIHLVVRCAYIAHTLVLVLRTTCLKKVASVNNLKRRHPPTTPYLHVRKFAARRGSQGLRSNPFLHRTLVCL